MKNTENIVKLTKTVVDRLAPPIGCDQIIYRDQELSCFGLRIMRSGVKSFVIEKRINGKSRRITLGRYGALTVEQARKEAQKALGKIVTGINPIAEKQQAKIKGLTLKEAFDDYLQARKNLKPKTRYDYENLLNAALADWKNKPLNYITKDKIESHHTFLGSEHGKTYANAAMRLLRALFNFAAAKYEDENKQALIIENPVKRLSKTRAWFPEKRRTTYIKAYQLTAWYKVTLNIENELIGDYLLTVLFTGLRKNEASRLSKTNVDLEHKTLTIPDTKNRNPHILPLPDHLCLILKRRIEASTNQYLFPGSGKAGYLIEPRKQIAKIREETGLIFTVQDLRRTFITIAESLDIPAYALKRLLNHKMKNDVTAGYIVTDVERLRKPMNMICDYILVKCLEDKQESLAKLANIPKIGKSLVKI